MLKDESVEDKIGRTVCLNTKCIRVVQDFSISDEQIVSDEKPYPNIIWHPIIIVHL